MGLYNKELEAFKKHVLESFNPYYLFDDDPDGLVSFLLCNKLNPGYWSCVKDSPIIKKRYALKALSIGADRIIILDKPRLDIGFFKALKLNTTWLDHHPPQEFDVVSPYLSYYNPRIKNPNDGRPTSFWVFKSLSKELNNRFKNRFEWLALIGCLGDYYWPRFGFKVLKQYENSIPNLFPKSLQALTAKKQVLTPKKTVKKQQHDKTLVDVDIDVNIIDQVLYKSRFGSLVKLFSYTLRLHSKAMRRIVKELSNATNIKELFDESIVKYGWRNYYSLESVYKQLMEKQAVIKKNILLLVYSSKYSLSGMLSNELSFKHPKKLVIVCRQAKNRYVCSLRSRVWRINRVLLKALSNVNGYGGGHEHACGATISSNDFERFLKNIDLELSKAKKVKDPKPEIKDTKTKL